MAHIPVAEMTDDQAARLREICEAAYTNWKAKSTPEMLAIGQAKIEQNKNDPSYYQTKIEEMKTKF